MHPDKKSQANRASVTLIQTEMLRWFLGEYIRTTYNEFLIFQYDIFSFFNYTIQDVWHQDGILSAKGLIARSELNFLERFVTASGWLISS